VSTPQVSIARGDEMPRLAVAMLTAHILSPSDEGLTRECLQIVDLGFRRK
jgi:hypothetical protein